MTSFHSLAIEKNSATNEHKAAVSKNYYQSPMQFITDFMQTYNDVYQPEMTIDDVDRLFSFTSDDMEDHHISYNVSFSGKEGRAKSTAGLLAKGENSITYQLTTESIILGRDSAVISFVEDAKYYKNGKEKHYVGRWILVLEINDAGKVSMMRRYFN